MRTYNIENKKYYLTNEIQEEYPKLFKVRENTRGFIRRIGTDQYIYARTKKYKGKTDNTWEKSEGNSQCIDKVFVLKKWFDETYKKSDKNSKKDEDKSIDEIK